MKESHQETMSTGAVNVPADSFHQKTDMNVMPTPVNVQLGGVPKHWLSTASISRRDMQTAYNAQVTLGENPRSYKVLTFDEFIGSQFEPNRETDK